MSEVRLRILLFFIGTVANYILIRYLIGVFPEFYDSIGLSLFIFIFPGFVGGLIAGEPWLGAAAGFAGSFPLYYYLVDGTIDPVPHLLLSIAGFIGGLIRKTLFRPKNKKASAEGSVDDA